MASGAKNHRFRLRTPTDLPAGRDERRGARDRRNPARAANYTGPERRTSPRRKAELPTPIWHQAGLVALAVALGIGAGVLLDSLQSPPPTPLAAVPDAAPRLDPQLLAQVESLRDEAEALTPAQVALDERAHEEWMPRVAAIEAAREDPSTPPALRHELDATLAALECVGILAPEDPSASATSCVTLER